MPDYTGNSKKARDADNRPPKVVERVIVTDVIVHKKGLGRKMKDLFIAADFKTVVRLVAADVLLPAAKNMLYDAWTATGQRTLFGETSTRHRGLNMGPRVTYNSPINRGYRDSPLRNAPTVSPDPRSSRIARDEFVISTREEAELVLEAMNDIIEKYDVVSVADLNELIGQATSPIDVRFGWTNLKNVQIQQLREGFLINFPQAEPIQ